VTFTLEAGSPPIDTPATVTANGEAVGTEPSLEQLTTFVDTLKGKKVHLYASSNGSFAHRLTSYLTAWEMDVSHINAEAGIETLPEAHPPSPTTALSPESYTVSGVPPKTEPRQPKVQPLSFIFIDDDEKTGLNRASSPTIFSASHSFITTTPGCYLFLH
ncbi:hypothetical protein MPER_05786, partial [Moniliophthora perniciosa FA553]